MADKRLNHYIVDVIKGWSKDNDRIVIEGRDDNGERFSVAIDTNLQGFIDILKSFNE